MMDIINEMSEAPSSGWAVVTISTSWCTYCAKTHKAIAEVAPSRPELAFVQIDGDENPDALLSVGAKTYPQLVLLLDGKKVAQRESANAEELEAWLQNNLI